MVFFLLTDRTPSLLATGAEESTLTSAALAPATRRRRNVFFIILFAIICLSGRAAESSYKSIKGTLSNI